MSEIRDVDLLALERTTGPARRAVVDGVARSPATGFVFADHDLSDDLLDIAYGMLGEFFALDNEIKQQFFTPGAHGQTGYTGLLVETAASSDVPDRREVLDRASPIDPADPLRRRFPAAYPDRVLPEAAAPGITDVLYRFHDSVAGLQRRFLRVIAEGIGCDEMFVPSHHQQRHHARTAHRRDDPDRMASGRVVARLPGRARQRDEVLHGINPVEGARRS